MAAILHKRTCYYKYELRHMFNPTFTTGDECPGTDCLKAGGQCECPEEDDQISVQDWPKSLGAAVDLCHPG